jgi:hypothetical protein
MTERPLGKGFLIVADGEGPPLRISSCGVQSDAKGVRVAATITEGRETKEVEEVFDWEHLDSLRGQS